MYLKYIYYVVLSANDDRGVIFEGVCTVPYNLKLENTNITF